MHDALIANVYGAKRDCLFTASGIGSQSSIRELRHGVACNVVSRIDIEGY
jgi:hypothetical protein